VIALGIDIGGSKLAYVVGDTDGTPRARWRRASEHSGDAESDVARIAADARRLLERSGVAPRDLAIVGVSCPGPLDTTEGVVLGPPNLPGWRVVPLRSWLEAELGSVEVGKRADLVLLDSNPLAAIGNMRSIRYTVRDGVAHTPRGWIAAGAAGPQPGR